MARHTMRDLHLIALVPTMLLVAACAAPPTTAPSPSPSVPRQLPAPVPAGGMTSQELSFARDRAYETIVKERALVSSVTVTAGTGTVTESNVGYACTSGRLLHVLLIGTFPAIVNTGLASTPGSKRGGDVAVSAVEVTADAKSGRTCLFGVRYGTVTPEPGSVSLSID